MEVISVKDVTFKYEGAELPVINNLSLSVSRGEYLCVLGENGSGKSTLARLINGLLTPNSGRVAVYGFDTKDKDKQFEVRKRVGMVFQNPDNQMVATMVEDDIAFGPENLGVPSKEIGERIDFALKSTNMENFRFSQGQKLSGGQKQRVAIAGVLAIMPEVLILDESTSMLDAKGRKEVLDVVKELNDKGMTVITITHYMDEAVNASRVVVLSKGEIVKDGKPSEIFKDSNELVSYGLELPRSTYIANKLIKKGLPLKEGILTAEELSEELCKLFQKG
ncbi:MAG: energy-coupling factor transporter ATPase [Clostridia bacterium]|nr:energy-coupling factor transporter ATPase [Clostridia bacterium]